MKTALAVAAVAALALTTAACGQKDTPEPQNEATGAMMPDTDTAAATGAETAPDAGATGTVPADGSAAPMQPTSPAAEGAGVGTTGGAGAGTGSGTPTTPPAGSVPPTN